jgi:putative nucleotidyltransferase with HDIG domain
MFHEPGSRAALTSRQALLFVDDEPRVLQGLERMLRPLRHEWGMTFVGGGVEALTALGTAGYDVLITDIRMPGMNGVELMERVRDHHPHVIRMALSGHAERGVVVRAVGLAHQFLSKPCEPELLKDTLAQALRLRTLLESATLAALLSRVSGVRSVPTLYAELTAEMQSSSPSVANVAAIVASDPGMTAKVLQLINSAYFGLRAHVSDPVRAVQLLGLETVRSLALSMQVFSQFENTTRRTSFSHLWQHSVRVARLARELARRMGLDQPSIDEAFTAGLLHDVGKLVLSDAVPECEARLTSAEDDCAGADRLAAERHAFGANHADVGAYVFGLWGLPYGLIDAVRWHHRPADSGSERPTALTAVHLANVFDHVGVPHGQPSSGLDDSYLAALGLTDAIPGWQAFALTLTAA